MSIICDRCESGIRTDILEGLKRLPNSCQLRFKRMYSHSNLDVKLDELVKKMPDDELDRALQQIQNTSKGA